MSYTERPLGSLRVEAPLPRRAWTVFHGQAGFRGSWDMNYMTTAWLSLYLLHSRRCCLLEPQPYAPSHVNDLPIGLV